MSEHSWGFRPGRSAHDAVTAARGYVAEGKEWVVDIDLASFFDQVNHDRLMHRLGERIGDKRMLQLIGRYLRAPDGRPGTDGTSDATAARRKVARFRRCWPTSTWTRWTGSWNGVACRSCAMPTISPSSWPANGPPSGCWRA